MTTQSLLIGGGGDPAVWVSGTSYTAGKVVWSPSDYQYYMRKSAGAGTTDPSSDTTNWHPTGDRAIKSIQRGVISIAIAAATGTATITSVNTSKTELRMLGFKTSGADNTFSAYLELTNSTTITATKTAVSGSPSNVSWELVERY